MAPIVDAMVVAVEQEERRRAANRARLVAAAGAPAGPLRGGRVRLGAALVAAGRRLQGAGAFTPAALPWPLVPDPCHGCAN